jgi:hypothetical protein
MCVTIDGKLAIMGALYKKQKCTISEVRHVADVFLKEIDDVNIVLNRVTISDFVRSRATCFSFDNKTAIIEKTDKEYEFPRRTIEYYLFDLPKPEKEKVLEMFFLDD